MPAGTESPAHKTPLLSARRLDVRSIFARERRSAPALLVLAAFAAFGALPPGAAAWSWLAAFVAIVGFRIWLAFSEDAAARPIATRAPEALAYAGAHGVDLVLWALLFAAIGEPATLISRGAGFAAGGAALVGALTLSGWIAARRILLAGWAIVAAIAIVRLGLSSHPFVVLFPLWLGAVAWMSARPSRAPPVPRRAGQHTEHPRTRLGWNTAIGAMPAAILLIRNGRIADINAAAAQLFNRDELSLMHRRVDDCLLVEPPGALDPEHALRESRAVVVTLLLPGADLAPWSAQVRVLEPGKAASTTVLALLRHSAVKADDGVAAEARRFAAGIGGPLARAWYRDETGRVYVPQGIATPPDAVAHDLTAFPLHYGVVTADRERIAAAWRAMLAAPGATFDERFSILDSRDVPRAVRVVGIARSAPAGEAPAIVGSIAPAQTERPAIGATLTELVKQLPALVWLVDPAGRVVFAHGVDAWRWGMRADPRDRPLWWDAFALRDDARVNVQTALQRALSGRPTYDLVNSRSTKTGGRIVLRSHFVPYQGAAPAGMAHAGTLVLDTIAAPSQLAEIDRLRRSKAQYRALVEASLSLIWACDGQFKFTFVSRRAAREIYGYEPDELLGLSIVTLLAAGPEQKAAKQAFARLRLGETMRNVEMAHVTKNGGRLVISVSAMSMKAGDGGFGGAIGMNADLTVLKLRERRLTEALRIERTVLDSAGQAIAVVKDGLVARCNDAFLQLLQAQPAALARTPIADFFAAADDWESIAIAADAARLDDRAAARELQIRRGSRAAGQGETAWCQLTARSIAPGEYVLVLADIDHIRQREADALHDAHHDELTGLANRRLLARRAGSALAATALRNASCGFFVIDLDGFKEINDSYGHEIGDRVLREVAARLLSVMRPQDTVARRSGDEFALVIPDVGLQVDAEHIAQRVLSAISQPYVLDESHASGLSASMGVALAPEHGRELDALLHLADLAMYEAKLRGKNQVAFASVAGAGATAAPDAPQGAWSA